MIVALASALIVVGNCAAQSAAGKAEYDKYCASCHGADGKGQGKMTYVVPGVNPPDLTLLSRNNGGVFPRDAATESIDGRRKIASHERLMMPFWGVTMQEPGKEFTPESEAAVKARINRVVDYLESMQRK